MQLAANGLNQTPGETQTEYNDLPPWSFAIGLVIQHCIVGDLFTFSGSESSFIDRPYGQELAVKPFGGKNFLLGQLQGAFFGRGLCPTGRRFLPDAVCPLGGLLVAPDKALSEISTFDG